MLLVPSGLRPGILLKICSAKIAPHHKELSASNIMRVEVEKHHVVVQSVSHVCMGSASVKN